MMYLTNPSIEGSIFLIVAVFVFSTTLTATFIIFNSSIKSLDSMQIILKEDQVICKRTNKPDKIIYRSDVGGIIQTKDGGIRIESIDRTEFIFVPNGLQNY